MERKAGLETITNLVTTSTSRAQSAILYQKEPQLLRKTADCKNGAGSISVNLYFSLSLNILSESKEADKVPGSGLKKQCEDALTGQNGKI